MEMRSHRHFPLEGQNNVPLVAPRICRSTVSKREMKETEQAVEGRNIRAFKKLNRHQEILREWGRESVSLTVIPQTVTEVMQKVSDSDTSKAEWTDVEWAVFLTRVIMDRADYVSEEDLYLLHDIMIRCQVGE